jgi:hypothetical protein
VSGDVEEGLREEEGGDEPAEEAREGEGTGIVKRKRFLV